MSYSLIHKSELADGRRLSILSQSRICLLGNFRWSTAAEARPDHQQSSGQVARRLGALRLALADVPTPSAQDLDNFGCRCRGQWDANEDETLVHGIC